MIIKPYILNRPDFLNYISEHSKIDGNKFIIKVGDMLRLADAIYGYENRDILIETKKWTA